jgi:hypothetical protein
MNIINLVTCFQAHHFLAAMKISRWPKAYDYASALVHNVGMRVLFMDLCIGPEGELAVLGKV